MTRDREWGAALRVVRVAALLVPADRREEWRREWMGELEAWRAAGRPLTGAAMGAIPHGMSIGWEAWTMRFDNVVRDIRLGARTLVRRPLFTATVTATLALGIGGSLAVFSVVDAVLLRPLPYPESDRIVVAGEASLDGRLGTTSFATWADWRDRTGSFTDLALVRASSVTLTGQGEPEQLRAVRVTPEFFDVVGVHPELGRAFRDDENHPAAPRVVVLSHGLWVRRFGADPAVVGRPVTLTGRDYTVVGVMPRDFEPVVSRHFYGAAEVWAPLRYTADLGSACRTCRHLRVVGRLTPGTTVDAAAADVGAVTAALTEEYPADYARPDVVVRSLHAEVTGELGRALWVLFGAVAFVLLIACANVTGLLLTRASERRSEVALRAALGADRGRLVTEAMTECLILAGLGGVAGLGLGALGTRLLVGLAPASLPGYAAVGMSGTVVLFAVVLTLLTAALAGIAPVLEASRGKAGDALAFGARSSAGRGQRRARGALVVADVAVALMLLVGVGLTLQSFVRVLRVDPGFEPDGVATMQVNALGAAYGDGPSIAAFHREVMRRVAEVPGVASVGVASQVPLGGSFDRVGTAIESIPDVDPASRPSSERYAIAGDYLETLGIPLLEGRVFDDRDAAEAEPVVLVNETFARMVWAEGGAIGQRIHLGGPDDPWRVIVGVVGDVRHNRLEDPAEMQVYLPQAQWASSYMTLAVRVRGEPAALLGEIRRAVWSVDGDIPVAAATTLERSLSEATAQRRFVVGLLSVFAAMALVLTSMGIYGLVAYHVTQRSHEIGIRVALGAARSDVFRLVVGQGLRLTLTGVALGLAGALVLTRFVADILYGVEPTDPATLLAVASLVAAVAMAASWMPARRALRLDGKGALGAPP